MVERQEFEADGADPSWSDAVARVKARQATRLKPDRRDPDEQEPEVGGSWIVRHWRGRLSLPVSYWVNGWLSSLLVVALTVGCGIANQLNPDPWQILALLVALYVMVVLVVAWQVVGTWRSATRSTRRLGTVFWPVVTKIVLVLGVLSNLGVLGAAAVPQIEDTLSFAQGDPTKGPRGVRILRGGTEIELVGYLASGVEAQVHEALLQAPRATTLHLASPGGRIAVALRIRDEIRGRKLATYVATECDSACTLIFLAGRERWLGPKGKLGFHQASFGGAAVGVAFDPMYQAYAEAGVGSAFLHHVNATTPSDIWYPTVDELKAVKVITDVAPVGKFALSGFGLRPDAAKIADDLLMAPKYQALKGVDAESWAGVVQTWTQAVRRGDTAVDATMAARPYTTRSVIRLAPLASDATLSVLATLLVYEAKRFGASNPDSCWAFVTGGGAPAADLLLTQDVVDRENAVYETVLKDAASASAVSVDGTKLKPLLRAAFRGAGRDPNLVDAPIAAADERPGYCQSVQYLYEAALALPSTKSAAALRYVALRMRGS
jgi:hypothetical protein